jgi:hypothetical protein
VTLFDQLYLRKSLDKPLTAALAFHLTQFILHAAPNAAQVDSGHAFPFLISTVGSRRDASHDSGVIERCVSRQKKSDMELALAPAAGQEPKPSASHTVRSRFS